nr:N-6 DNA methylase [Kibdelosporangium sp. MJ126-NF4]CEL17646.1 hypothetical protein [Kibdelosporangium sp. MJ126-NF4]CTQ91127.1 hypothetical protein [Kibdelosporangium sp. MJ126-NF4]
MATRKKVSPPSNVVQHAHKIAEAVEAAWYGSHGSGRLEVPVSVIATLAAAPQRDPQGVDGTEAMLHWEADDFVRFARMVWRSVIQHRPETTHLLYPLIGWWFDDVDTEMRQHVHKVARAALHAGQVDLTGTDRRFEVDLLGAVLTVLRPKSALKAHGQFYTPGCVATLMARMSSVEEGNNVEDPMMGTGGMFRAVAEGMRESGQRPSTMRWLGCDIDETAVACATVNSMIWGLGHDIVFHVGNTLVGDWQQAALAQRDHLQWLAAQIRRDKQLLSLLGMWPGTTGESDR